MPLLDHFHPPLSRTHPWRSFHGAWAAAMARLLNAGVLPPGYYAVPFLDHEGPVEIDVATLGQSGSKDLSTTGRDSELWMPPAPSLTMAVAWPASDDVRVEVMTDSGDPPLAAAIELLSPSNKDRLESRQAFASKCAEYLRRGCGLVVVDLITARRADIRSDLFSELGQEPESAGPETLSATAYKPVGGDTVGKLLAWPHDLEIGARLPTLPLWIAPDQSVPLNLEASYSAACGDLRISPGETIPAA